MSTTMQNLTIRLPTDLIRKLEERARKLEPMRPGILRTDVAREILASHFYGEEEERRAACDPPPQTPK